MARLDRDNCFPTRQFRQQCCRGFELNRQNCAGRQHQEAAPADEYHYVSSATFICIVSKRCGHCV